MGLLLGSLRASRLAGHWPLPTLVRGSLRALPGCAVRDLGLRDAVLLSQRRARRRARAAAPERERDDAIPAKLLGRGFLMV